MSELWACTATEIAEAVSAGDVSAVDVARAALDRIAAIEPRHNALSEITEAQAMDAATAVDAARRAGDDLGPLAGVPVTTKNNVDQAGTRNTGGISLARDLVATEDSPLVARLRSAGAVIVGRSNVPAFSFRWFTDTDLHGRTLNPFDAALSPGGSSGGAAVSVATGECALAHGNDIGGSIRHPAHMNGVFGLRPTVGRVPSYVPSGGGLRALTSQLITADGPIARSLADIRLGLSVMGGMDPMDPQSVPVPAVGHAPLPARVGLMRGTPAAEVDAAMTRTAKALEDAGVQVNEITLPHFEEAAQIWLQLAFGAMTHHYMDAVRASGDSALIHNLDLVREIVPAIDSGQTMDLWAQRLQIMRAWSQVFETYAVIILPVSYRHGLRVDADQGSQAELEALLKDQSPLLATALMGHPGLAVPTGLAEDGVPTGIQLAARWWDEASLLAAGEVLEDAFPPVTPVPTG